jgi:hypothetical protein
MPDLAFSVALSTGLTDIVEADVSGLSTFRPTIFINPTGLKRGSKDELDTWIHEPLHHALPGLSEAEVERIAGDLAAILWKAGYRRKATKK